MKLFLLVLLQTLFAFSPVKANVSPPLFVISGGLLSCRFPITNVQPSWNNIFASYKSVERNKYPTATLRPQFIFTCYSNNSSTISVSSSQDPSRSFTMHESLLADYVFQVAGPSDVVIVGHSMGGWLAMHLVLGLQGRLRIRNLTTIDPISPVLCGGASSPGCYESPQDFTDRQFRSIRNRVKDWRNYYQTVSRRLHSSPISSADQNIKLDSAHLLISRDEKVWNDIYSIL